MARLTVLTLLLALLTVTAASAAWVQLDPAAQNSPGLHVQERGDEIEVHWSLEGFTRNPATGQVALNLENNRVIQRDDMMPVTGGFVSLPWAWKQN
ncbi:hypothetical protein GF324_03480 [bacterium]|nr:hypothetical protein [bacterium]